MNPPEVKIAKGLLALETLKLISDLTGSAVPPVHGESLVDDIRQELVNPPATITEQISDNFAGSVIEFEEYPWGQSGVIWEAETVKATPTPIINPELPEHPVPEGKKVSESVQAGSQLKIGPDVVLRDMNGAETTDKLNDEVADVAGVEGGMVIIKTGTGKQYKLWADGSSEKTQLTPIERVAESDTGSDMGGGGNETLPSLSVVEEKLARERLQANQRVSPNQNLLGRSNPEQVVNNSHAQGAPIKVKGVFVSESGRKYLIVDALKGDGSVAMNGLISMEALEDVGLRKILSAANEADIAQLGLTYDIQQTGEETAINSDLGSEGYIPVEQMGGEPTVKDRTANRKGEGFGLLGVAAPIKAVRLTKEGFPEGQGGRFNGRVIQAWTKPGTNALKILVDAFPQQDGSIKRSMVTVEDTFNTITFYNTGGWIKASGFNYKDIEKGDYLAFNTMSSIAGQTPEEVTIQCIELMK